VHVLLHVAVPPLITVPSEALVARGDKLQVALIRDGKLHFTEVEPGRNDGHVRHRGGEASG
jgi:hypothetical protein